MKSRFSITVLIAFLATALLVSMPANAGLQDALDGMFLTTTTAPAGYSSQARGGFVGGGAAMRTPIRAINLLAFDPPRYSSGCGGIDLYGGSFSFINADQLVALFRQIAANAVGVAFRMAIDAINPALGKLMQDFQSIIQNLNGLMKNTCAIANQVVKTASNSLRAAKNDADEQATKEESAKGSTSDLFASITGLFSTPNKAVSDNQSTCDSCGNLVWKALNDSGSASYLGNPVSGSDTNPDMTKQIIMSMLGTIVNSGASTGTNSTGNEKPNTASRFEATIGLSNLLNGSINSPFTIWSCGGSTDRNACLAPSTSDITFDGMRGYTNRMLFGASDGSSTSDGIVAKLSSCETTDCGFTTSQKAFIGSISTPALKLLRDVQRSPGAMDIVAHTLAPVIADELIIFYGEAALKAANQAFSVTKGDKPDNVIEAQKQLVQEMQTMRVVYSQQTQRMMSAKSYAEAVVSSNPAALVSVNRR